MASAASSPLSTAPSIQVGQLLRSASATDLCYEAIGLAAVARIVSLCVGVRIRHAALSRRNDECVRDDLLGCDDVRRSGRRWQ